MQQVNVSAHFFPTASDVTEDIHCVAEVLTAPKTTTTSGIEVPLSYVTAEANHCQLFGADSILGGTVPCDAWRNKRSMVRAPGTVFIFHDAESFPSFSSVAKMPRNEEVPGLVMGNRFQ
jgi:hypothetical protein